MVCYFPEWSLEVGGLTILDRNCVYLFLVIGIWHDCVIAAPGLIYFQTKDVCTPEVVCSSHARFEP